jgi:riboflavin kinase
MGVPTANIDPKPLLARLSGLPKGVYFGWAKLDAPSGWPTKDGDVHKMVMNIGRRPTVSVEGEDDVSVEVHMMHGFSQDFYGQNLQVVALGFLRPEMKFPGGISELIARIRADIAISKNQLDEPSFMQYQKLL